MGGKMKDATLLSEPTNNNATTQQIESNKKKKNKKNKHKEIEAEEEEEQQNELNLKRKLEAIETANGAEKKNNKEKKEKRKQEKELEEIEISEQSHDDDDGGHKKKQKKKKNKEDRDKANGKESENGDDETISFFKEEDDGQVVVTGKDVKEAKYKALKSFTESKLPDDVLGCCKNFKNPSPIQSHAWPFLLNGRDFIGIAKTGSGKTIAFGVPAMMHVLSNRKGKPVGKRVNPLCLVLSPTRELADQIYDVLNDAGKPCGVKSVCVYGGTSKQPQITALQSGVDIVIGTPGRLIDLIEMNVCHLSEVSFVVLDEADRMLDMGFEEPVRFILSKISLARQMVMFSATWPIEVHKLAQEYMDPNPVKVVVGSEDLAANHDVMQIVEVLDDRSRDQRLLALLEKYHKSQRNRVLVFALYQLEADRLENMLRRSGWKVVAIHGKKAQHERTKSLSLFKEGTCPLMVATDVAARGLDIPDVEVVINYSFPLTTEDYVHRIGRTGRAGKKGVSHTFFTNHNKALAGELVNVLREARQVVPDALLKFGTHVKKKESKLYGAHFREISADAPKAKKITFNNSDDED
ncbi:DEAD-box ATP-dependent RNA helicase 5 [Citrus sinensis]|uniref:DEAD-box ATP-dependent RNA helicase 5 n=1 Tax=Citrus sinensis TaxID=2711 RepID=UPI002195526E|nr:DEAD-box ATP-dependent RNA helicase 5 [Citrus sinensis]KAH9687220.1 DEAD-box ATP-dependent RNA helicase 5 [Citrus sinensis]